jgi:lipoprotein-anchoring transpeptidase ErfK/SrfK
MSPLLPLVFSIASAISTPTEATPTRTSSSANVTREEATATSQTVKPAVEPDDSQDDAVNAAKEPCHWWQKVSGRCPEKVTAAGALPPEAPRAGVVVAVDTQNNIISLYNDGELVDQGPAATGSGKYLKRGLKEWLFHTPRGRQVVRRKLVDPVWTKPDWAFIEEGKPVPPRNSPKRQVKGHLGRYALDLGDGIMIHGTDDPNSLGRKVSHGCIRVGDELLEKIYQNAKVGTEVYVY